jgi:hypothetical protein
MGVLIRLPQTIYGRVNFAVARRRGEPLAFIDWDRVGADDYARWRSEQARREAEAKAAEVAEQAAIEAAKIVPFRHYGGGHK